VLVALATLRAVTVLLATHPTFGLHDPGAWHPEAPGRLDAVAEGLAAAELADAVVPFVPAPAPDEAITRVHPGAYASRLEALAATGGGHVDADTVVGPHSWEAAVLAAGAGLEAIARLDAGDADAAFCAVRPPGHHATPTRAMGFCLVNSAAVAAASLADRGERVLLVDFDVHHGNGTQDIFYDDDRVVYVSMHEYPLYPGTGALHETGQGPGAGATINVPLPSGATGDAHRHAVDALVAPLAEAWSPTWLVVSAGFDAHRADPLAGLALTAGDFADLTDALVALVPAGRRLFFLEGGYDRAALAASAGATLAVLAGERYRPEPASSGGSDGGVVDAVRRWRDECGWA
jgi:acetoin utilization deacetylase AcuC-like enzyme